MALQIAELGVSADLAQMEAAYLRSRTLRPEQYNAMVRLLEIFGRNLSAAANQVALQESESEPPLVRRARAFISGHSVDPLTLGQAAAALHVSTFHFCKIFKKGTGLTFTDYLGRVRVERAKSMLVNPNLRVTEIAYATGFQSLTHFNRLFSKVVGSSPTTYRASLPRPRGRDEG
jgi:YesN/AraC family two-component response regulator